MVSLGAISLSTNHRMLFNKQFQDIFQIHQPTEVI